MDQQKIPSVFVFPMFIWTLCQSILHSALASSPSSLLTSVLRVMVWWLAISILSFLMMICLLVRVAYWTCGMSCIQAKPDLLGGLMAISHSHPTDLIKWQWLD